MSYSRQLERERKAAEKAAKERGLELRQKEVDKLNKQLEDHLNALQTVLQTALDRIVRPEYILGRMVESVPIPLPPAKIPQPPDKKAYEARIPSANTLERLTGIGKKKRLSSIEEIQQNYKKTLEVYHIEKAKYDAQVEARNRATEALKQAVAELHGKITTGEPEAVTRYFTSVLERSPYTAPFSMPEVTLAYNRETKELVLEYDLPTYDAIMPTIRGYKFVKTRNEAQKLELTKTDENRMKSLYEDIIAAIALRSLHELFEADFAEVLTLVVFNGMVDTVDKATGKDIRPCLISVQVTKETFKDLNLARVDKKNCLKGLKAQTSPSSKELVPIKPLVELVTTDSRFIKEVDVLSGIDSRTNLLNVTPSDFEHLISNLFAQMGYKTGTTRITRDEGVDVIAFDERPIVGGKIIIQAKRYKNTVGVESVRALYGVMQDEGATKGILVTTSSFGTASREFAKNKPVELIDGNHLLHLLEKHAGIRAKIEMPL